MCFECSGGLLVFGTLDGCVSSFQGAPGDKGRQGPQGRDGPKVYKYHVLKFFKKENVW